MLWLSHTHDRERRTVHIVTVIGYHIQRHWRIHDRLTRIIHCHRRWNNFLHEEVIESRLTTVRVQPYLAVIQRTINRHTRLHNTVGKKTYLLILHVKL